MSVCRSFYALMRWAILCAMRTKGSAPSGRGCSDLAVETRRRLAGEAVSDDELADLRLGDSLLSLDSECASVEDDSVLCVLRPARSISPRRRSRARIAPLPR